MGDTLVALELGAFGGGFLERLCTRGMTARVRQRAAEAADADVVVINTCSVRERAEEKLYTRLGELRELAAEQGHDPIVAVAGCVAQQEGAAIFKRSPGVADVVVGTQAIRRLPMLVAQAGERRT